MTNDDGWTFVSTPSRRRRNPQTTNQQTPSADHPAWPPISRDLTVDALLADLAIKSHLWRTSDCRRQVLQILDRLRLTTRPDEQWTIDQAVCLGSGSFSRDNLDTRRRSMLQLAFFLDLVHVLREASSSSTDGEKREIVLLAQDPAYTPLDVAFLRAKNVQVYWSATSKASAPVERRNDAGDVLDRLKSTSLVCEWFMERRPEFLERLLDAEVQLVVGSMLTDAGQIALQRSRITISSSHDSASDESERAKLEFVNLEKQYNQEYRPYRIPRFEPDQNTFSGLHIAARMAAHDDDDDDD